MLTTLIVGRPARLVRRFVLPIVLILLLATTLPGQVLPPIAVAKSGMQAPGTPAGTLFGVPGGGQAQAAPSMSGTGSLIFYGGLVGTGVTPPTNDFGIWMGSGSGLQIVARKGDAAPVTGGMFAEASPSTDFPTTGVGGNIVFRATLVPGVGGVTTANDQGIWTGTPGSLQLLVRKGDVAAGAGAATFASFFAPFMTADHRVITAGTLNLGGGISTANDFGYWFGQPGNLQAFVREGDVAQGTGGATFSSSGLQMFAMNTSGVTMFRNALTLGGSVTTDNQAGIWSGTPGALNLVMRAGDPAPVTGGTILGFGAGTVLADGRTAVNASLVLGGSITESNDRGLWVGTNLGDLQLALRKGDPAPGQPAGVVLGGIGFARAYDNVVTFSTVVAGTGVTTANDRAIFTWSEATGVTTVAREGNVAPGTGGALFGQIGSTSPAGFGAFPSVGPGGVIAFYAPLTGAGVTTANDTGIWIRDAGGLKLVARKGDVIDLDPGVGVDNATILNLTLVDEIRNPAVGYSPFDLNGNLGWLAVFTDGRSAVLITPVPEPTLILAVAAGAWITRRLTRRAAGAASGIAQ